MEVCDVAALYLYVKVAVKALDEDNEAACQVVSRWGLNGFAGILWTSTNQEAL